MRASVFILFLLLAPIVAIGQATAHFTDPNSHTPVLINEIRVTGTRSLDSKQLSEIIGSLNQSKIGGTGELSDRLRFKFQDYGYFLVDVKSVSVKRLDPLATLPPVDVEAEVDEGPRFRFDTIQFTGNHRLSSEELLSEFPIRKGEYFSRTKVASGLIALREAYGKLGYLDFMAAPQTEVAPAAASLKLLIDVEEGPQFRMGSLQFAGNPDLAEQLRSLWKLEAGAPYDGSYLPEFVKENEALLPQHFNVRNSTKLARNCTDKTVTVFVELGPNHPSVAVPQDVGCDEESRKASREP